MHKNTPIQILLKNSQLSQNTKQALIIINSYFMIFSLFIFLLCAKIFCNLVILSNVREISGKLYLFLQYFA